MGGNGSGRLQENYTACDLLVSEGDFKNVVVTKTVNEYETVVDFLMMTIKGQETDVVVTPKGDIVTRQASLEVRVKAAKGWQEMTLDKIVSDKKTIDNPNQGSLLDMLACVNEVHDALEKARAEKANTPLNSNQGRTIDG